MQQPDQGALGHPQAKPGIRYADDLVQRQAQLDVQIDDKQATFGPDWTEAAPGASEV